MSMMYCQGCGAQMHEAAAACPACGKPNAMLQIAASKSGWFSFQGRISRKTYWLNYCLPLALGAIIVAIFDYAAGANEKIIDLYYLAAFVPSLAAGVKRLHDRNKSGWFYLISLIPIIGSLWLFIDLGCLRGTLGPNRFGPDPLADDRYPIAPTAATA